MGLTVVDTIFPANDTDTKATNPNRSRQIEFSDAWQTNNDYEPHALLLHLRGSAVIRSGALELRGPESNSWQLRRAES